MTHNGEESLSTPTEDSNAHVDATRLIAETKVAVHHGVSCLADYTQRAEVARDALRADSNALLADVTKARDTAMRRCHDAQIHVERAAKALAVRALEVDTAAIRVTEREAAVAQRERDVAKSASQLAAKAASVRYAVIEQAKLHATAHALDARAARIAHAETMLADSTAAATAREARTDAHFRRTENALREREAALEQREACIAAHEASSLDAFSRALLQIERDRAAFWGHQQRVSADIARITEDLFAFHKEVKSEVGAVAVATRASLAHVENAVSQFIRTVKDARTTHTTSCEVASSEEKHGDARQDKKLQRSLESFPVYGNITKITPAKSDDHEENEKRDE